MNTSQFVLAIAVLLSTPGPTNTLLSLAAYGRGFLPATSLLAGEVAGYLTVIVPVAVLAAPLLDTHPTLLPLVKLAAGAWVLMLAYRLWSRSAAPSAAREIGVAQVYVTTVLNPKAPIIALTIMPHGPFGDILPWLAGFTVLTMTAGTGWLLMGSGLGRAARGAITGRSVRRVAALCLVCFSMALAGASIRALI